jgi:hypothetical protein
MDRLLRGEFSWTCNAPLVSPARRPADPCYSVKDPTLVRHDGRWHLFCTIRSEKRSHQIEYLTFEDWPKANGASRHILTLTNGYRLKGSNQYLTVIEAQGEGGRRYYKAYLADRLEGAWKALAATAGKPFAGPANVQFQGAAWGESISHGELLRTGVDERMEVDPAHLEFLFQGVTDARRAGKKYGEIPWELGLLTPLP